MTKSYYNHTIKVFHDMLAMLNTEGISTNALQAEADVLFPKLFQSFTTFRATGDRKYLQQAQRIGRRLLLDVSENGFTLDKKLLNRLIIKQLN